MPTNEGFTGKELGYLLDRDFLLAKNGITEKLVAQFATLESELKAHVSSQAYAFPAKTLAKAGKISKGENYKGLPYVMLDFPRLFQPESVFAYRSMFWWGNFFSFTLHVQGSAWAEVRKKLADRIDILLQNGENTYVCVSDTPWEYTYERSNYLPVKEFSKEALFELLNRHSFLKLSRYTPVDQWAKLIELGIGNFSKFMACIR